MHMEQKVESARVMSPDELSVELSSRRTGMSFQRTRMSADRTLMSVIRTALSLISFGFTIYQFLGKVAETQGWGSGPARRFGFALVLLGVVMLVTGIAYQLSFMSGLRRERVQMKAEGLIHAESRFPVSMTLITAVLLLAAGLLAITSMVFRAGPFG
jgi:putative membrane protein